MKYPGHHHGIALPIGALRTDESLAIGEYLDLLPLIDWCHDIGFDVIQLLPFNDTGGNSSPYLAQSAHALHPIYLSLRRLPFLEKIPGVQEMLQQLSCCNTSKRFHYLGILRNKELFLRIYFEACFSEIELLPEYQKFIAQHTSWLDIYALFSALKTQNDQAPWWNFKEESVPLKEVNFYKMVQFLAFSQWAEVKKLAEQKGVLLKGDIPILISKDSADVWSHQNLFFMNLTAGAPPDMYNAEGQNWGFPTYNWKEHEKEDYSWWKSRLKVAEGLFHLYRIDHIVGFFRIWVIPLGKSAKEGFFVPQDVDLWIPHGEKLLKMLLSASDMFPIGEDLGVIPPAVRTTMLELGIPGTKVYRWERRWQEDGSYIPVEEYIPESMMTVSTHDSETLAEWWNKGDEEVLSFCAFKGWHYAAPLSYDKRLAILADCHRSMSRFHINLLQEYLCLFGDLSWFDPLDERINIPGVISDWNWTYRFRPLLSQITSHPQLAAVMRSLSGLT